MTSGSGEIVGNSWSAPDMTSRRNDEALIRRSMTEELQERILAKLPFPEIFQLRTLSKSWHGKLSSISSQDDQEKKLLAASFQRQVCEQSDKWGSFGPIFFFEGFLITCDLNLTSKRWYKIPILSFLPEEAAMKVRSYFLDYSQFCPSMVGVLLFITTALENTMYVVNILTGSRKELPAVPEGDNGRIGAGIRLVSSQEMYKVIRLFSEVGYLSAWIYDSKVGTWSKKIVAVEEDFEVGYVEVYLNGNIYVPLHVDEQVWGLLIFHVNDETFQLLKMPLTAVLSGKDLRWSDIVACDGTVYFVLPNRLTFVDLVKADLVKRTWFEPISCPADNRDFSVNSNPLKDRPSSNDECIFFEQEGTTGRVLTYNARTNQWSSFPKGVILERSGEHFSFQDSFQPGMNPFLEV